MRLRTITCLISKVRIYFYFETAMTNRAILIELYDPLTASCHIPDKRICTGLTGTASGSVFTRIHLSYTEQIINKIREKDATAQPKQHQTPLSNS